MESATFLKQQKRTDRSSHQIDIITSGNPFKCHEEVLYLQPLIPPKRFDISPPLTG